MYGHTVTVGFAVDTGIGTARNPNTQSRRHNPRLGFVEQKETQELMIYVST